MRDTMIDVFYLHKKAKEVAGGDFAHGFRYALITAADDILRREASTIRHLAAFESNHPKEE